MISKRRGGFFMDDLNLIGVDYLWRVSEDCYAADLQFGLLLLGFELLSLQQQTPFTALRCFVRRICQRPPGRWQFLGEHLSSFGIMLLVMPLVSW